MIRIRRALDRGHADHGWLDTWHTFSFDSYYDPEHMGFRSLRVMNEDRVQPGAGFPPHPHRDMEIVTVVLEGAIAHRDNMGHEGELGPGEVQRMSAGTGVVHSESNPSSQEPLHLYQIWILPERPGLKPEYEQKAFPESERRGRLRLVASRDARDGSLTIHQDADLYSAILRPKQEVVHALRAGRHAWLQVARGQVALHGQELAQGDGAAVTDARELAIVAGAPSEILLFDLA